MNDKQRDRPDAAAGIPQSDPPPGGPHKDDDTPNPADLAPGFGGTSRTKPASSDDEAEDDE